MTTARIIALAMNPWDGPWMNRQQILSRLGRSYPILYSTGVLSTWDLKRPEWRHSSWRGGFEARDHVLLDQPPAWLLRVRNHAGIDGRVLRMVAQRWRMRMRDAGTGPLVAYVFHPRMWPYVKALDADVVLYHAYDLFKLQVGWSDAVAQDERELIARADVVLGSSEMICDELRAQGAGDPVLLPNAADFDAFAAEPRGEGPADLAAIPHPRIGYIGKLSRKVDLDLVGALAASHPDWHFVFVGSADRLDSESREGRDRLDALDNVHFLGFKPHTALPDYAARMDCNIICHRTDDALWTKGTFPLKLFEYLASGPPVVSADIPSVRPYSDVVALACGTDEWERAVCAAVEGRGHGSRDARRAVARANTWNDRVEQVNGLLQGAIERCCTTRS